MYLCRVWFFCVNVYTFYVISSSIFTVYTLLLIDFSKAFHMVHHSILLKKLERYSVWGLTLKWIGSYLSGRKHFVSVNGSNSNTLDIKYGVPQWSILDHLLFIIYINDIPERARYTKFILYADDAYIILTADTVALKWFKVNFLN